jgi:hypothetical protein
MEESGHPQGGHSRSVATEATDQRSPAHPLQQCDVKAFAMSGRRAYHVPKGKLTRLSGAKVAVATAENS